MSWYKRRPRIKEPPKHLPHHRNSPTTEKILEEVAKKQSSEKKTEDKTKQ